MRVIIAGSRKGCDPRAIDKAMRRAIDVLGPPSEIVSGGARGVDTQGEAWANEHGIPVKTFPADWIRHGHAAGPIRNREMAFYGDALVLLWDGKSRGSKNMRKHAEAEEIQLFEHILPEQGED